MTIYQDRLLFCIKAAAKRAKHFRKRSWISCYAWELRDLKRYPIWYRHLSSPIAVGVTEDESEEHLLEIKRNLQ